MIYLPFDCVKMITIHVQYLHCPISSGNGVYVNLVLSLHQGRAHELTFLHSKQAAIIWIIPRFFMFKNRDVFSLACSHLRTKRSRGVVTWDMEHVVTSVCHMTRSGPEHRRRQDEMRCNERMEERNLKQFHTVSFRPGSSVSPVSSVTLFPPLSSGLPIGQVDTKLLIFKSPHEMRESRAWTLVVGGRRSEVGVARMEIVLRHVRDR